MKKSALHELHTRAGAEFQEESGLLMPKKFEDVNDEVLNVRNKIGVTDLSHRGKLKLSGKEHLKFLQGMITNDILALNEGSGLYATMLTVKGKMISDMSVYKKSESVYLDLEPYQNIKVKEHLLKFRLSYKSDINDITEAYSLFHICGLNAGEFLDGFLSRNLSGLNENNFIEIILNNYDLIVIKKNRTGETGFDIIVENRSAENIWNKIIAEGGEYDLRPFGLQALDVLRIEAGIAKFGIDMDENTIPIEAGLWNALNFEKGCYVGQEVIARIKWRGRVNWHLVGFAIEGKIIAQKENDIISNSKKIGRITSSAFSPTLNKNIAMGYIRREYKDPGTPVTILVDSENVKAKVAELPHYTNFK